MWTAANFIMEGRRLCTVVLEAIVRPCISRQEFINRQVLPWEVTEK